MSMNSRFDEPALRWLEELADDGRAVVFVRDVDRQTTYVSDNVEEVTGWQAEDFVDRLYSLAHPDDQAAVFEASRRIRESGTDCAEVPVRVLLPSGGFRWFMCRLEDRLDDPQVGGIVVRMEPLGSAVSALERHFRLLSTTSDIIVVLDDDLRPEYVSPSVEHVLGFSPDEIPRRWREILHAGDIATFESAGRHVMTEPAAERQVRIRGRRADGELRTFDVLVANRLDDEPINGILVSARDVTDLVEAEERLGITEMRFQVLVETSPDVFMLLDESTTVLFVSSGIESMVGLEAAEVLGTTALDFVHEDDVARAAVEMERMLTTGETAHIVLRVEHTERRYTWVEASGANHLDTPGLHAIVVSLRDVTERVEEEQRMERLMRDATSGAFVVDRDLNVTWATPGVERFIGTGRQLHADGVRAMFEMDDRADPIAVFEEVVAGDRVRPVASWVVLPREMSRGGSTSR